MTGAVFMGDEFASTMPSARAYPNVHLKERAELSPANRDIHALGVRIEQDLRFAAFE
jgi:hypothetical protein